MKQKKYLFQLLILAMYSFFVFSQQEEAIEISPFIGTTLDRVERDYFNVLPAIEGFEEAKFYLNPDGSLKADIKLNRNGVESDTILDQYSSPNRLEMLIVNNIIKNIPKDDDKIVTIKLTKEKYEIKDQRIFTINDSSMFTINNSLLEEKVSCPRYSMVKGTRLPEIENAIIPGQNVSDFILPSMLVGGGVGFLTGIITFGISNSGGNYSENELLSAFEGASKFGALLYSSAVGALIGAGIALLISPIVGAIFSEDDQLINPNTPSGLAELEPYISLQKTKKQKE